MIVSLGLLLPLGVLLARHKWMFGRDPETVSAEGCTVMEFICVALWARPLFTSLMSLTPGTVPHGAGLTGVFSSQLPPYRLTSSAAVFMVYQLHAPIRAQCVLCHVCLHVDLCFSIVPVLLLHKAYFAGTASHTVP